MQETFRPEDLEILGQNTISLKKVDVTLLDVFEQIQMWKEELSDGDLDYEDCTETKVLCKKLGRKLEINSLKQVLMGKVW